MDPQIPGFSFLIFPSIEGPEEPRSQRPPWKYLILRSAFRIFRGIPQHSKLKVELEQDPVFEWSLTCRLKRFVEDLMDRPAVFLVVQTSHNVAVLTKLFLLKPNSSGESTRWRGLGQICGPSSVPFVYAVPSPTFMLCFVVQFQPSSSSQSQVANPGFPTSEKVLPRVVPKGALGPL